MQRPGVIELRPSEQTNLYKDPESFERTRCIDTIAFFIGQVSTSNFHEFEGSKLEVPL